jgi:hypothetical protein
MLFTNINLQLQRNKAEEIILDANKKDDISLVRICEVPLVLVLLNWLMGEKEGIKFSFKGNKAR